MILQDKSELVVVLVGLYRYQNFTVRMMHSLLENIDGVTPHTIFVKNCDSNVFEPLTPGEEAVFIKLITELNPALIGFNVLSPYVPIAKRLTKLIKDNNPSTLVVWGGIHPTISPESCIDDVDMLCVGEGEGALTDLVTCLRDKKPYQSVGNLWIRTGGSIIKNPMRPFIQDLDSLPFPSYGNSAYYFIDSKGIKRKDPVLSDNYFWVYASRGCPYACSYCVNPILQSMFRGLGPYVRRRSVDNIIKEIKGVISAPGNMIDYVLFIDEVFGTEERWIDEFEERYKKEIGLPFHVQYNPKDINAKMLDKLIRAGLDTVNFGIQTGSDHIRNRIFNRAGKNSEIVDLAKQIRGRGIKVKYDLILNNPYETEESLKKGIEFLLQLPKELFFNLYSLQYFPNYPLTRKAIEDGHIAPEDTTADILAERTTKHWAFVPKLLPYTKKQILENIIWLVVWNHAKDRLVKYAVFGDSFGSRSCLAYLNLKAVFLGKILGTGSIVLRHRWGSYLINSLTYIMKGDFKNLYLKAKKRIILMAKNK